MKKAIIDPRIIQSKIVGWNTSFNPPQPVYEVIPNSARVAEVQDTELFPVAEPLFWADCADDVVADQWYYDTVLLDCFVIPLPPPVPTSGQPGASGTQTL